MHTKTTFLKGFRAVALVGIVSLILGSSLVAATQVDAAGLLLDSVAITSSPSTICLGQSGHLTWTSTNATSIWIDQGIGSVSPFGSMSVSPTQTTTYTIVGTNSTGASAVASATVYVSGPCSTPTPTPIYSGTLICTPSYNSGASGSTFSFTALGGNGFYSWTVDGVSQGTTNASTFWTTLYNYNTSDRYAAISVASNGQTSGCQIRVTPAQYVTPTPYPYGSVTMAHSVTNLTRGGQGTSVTAYNGDRLQFITTITTGNQYAYNVFVRDWLPQYTSYLAGTTTVNGSFQADGITTNSSLSLGTLSPNQTYTVSFSAIVNSAPTMVLNNSVNVHVDGLADQNRMSTISIIGSSYYPTPTVNPIIYTNGQGISLAVYGRDVTLGQSKENSRVIAHGNDTVDIIIHVRSTSSAVLSNVYVTDMLPSGLNYVSRSTILNGTLVGDGITTSGLNIGTLYPNQEAVVKFSAVVDPAAVPGWGQVDLSNTAQVRADGVNTISARLPVTLGSALSIAAISQVKTGPADSVILAALFGIVVTGLYAMYTNTHAFGRRLSLVEIQKSASRKTAPNFLG